MIRLLPIIEGPATRRLAVSIPASHPSSIPRSPSHPVSWPRLPNAPRNFQWTRPFSTSHTTQQSAGGSQRVSEPSPRKSRHWTVSIIGIGLLSGALIYYALTPSPSASALSPTSFTRFKILGREAVSPNSYILTLSPENPSLSPNLPYSTPSSPWNTRLWAIEIRQPQLQIVRHYTPLPPRLDVPEDRQTLRILIRTVPRGEVSNYLGKLPIGEAVDVRLEESFYDFAHEDSMRQASSGAPEKTEPPKEKKETEKCSESHTQDVVLLAGGTGIATALQAIHALHSSQPSKQIPNITVFWSVRSRNDIQTIPSQNKPPKTSWFPWKKDNPLPQLTPNLENPTQITHHLQSLSSPTHLKIYTTIDDEQTSISNSALKSAIVSHTPESTLPQRPKSTSGTLYTEPLGPQSWHLFRTRNVNAVSPVQRILIASGPDGFVERHAGHVLLHRVDSTSGDASHVFRRHGGTFVDILREGGSMAGWSIVDVPPRPAQVALGGL